MGYDVQPLVGMYHEFQPIKDLYLSGICHIYHDFQLIVGMYHKYVWRHDLVTRTTDSGAQDMDFTCSALLSRGSEVILELNMDLHVVHFYLGGSESILELKIGVFHVVHFYLVGLSLFGSS